MCNINPKDFILSFSVCWATFQFSYPFTMRDPVWTQKCPSWEPQRSQLNLMLASNHHSLLSVCLSLLMIQSQTKLNELCISSVFIFKISSLRINVRSTCGCVPMSANIFAIVFFYSSQCIFSHITKLLFVSMSFLINFLLDSHISSLSLRKYVLVTSLINLFLQQQAS